MDPCRLRIGVPMASGGRLRRGSFLYELRQLSRFACR